MTENSSETKDQVTPQAATFQTAAPEDRLNKTVTMYDVSVGEVFWRNLLAGFSRALGGMLIYVVVTGIMGFFLTKALFPYIQPLFGLYTQGFSALQDLNRGPSYRGTPPPASVAPSSTPAE
jgi:hypothetical protein